MTKQFELHEFFVEGGGRKNTHVLLHISEPAPGEQHKGYFFAVCEIEHATLSQVEHLQTMIDDIESSYYETVSDRNKQAFENTLQFMNKRGERIMTGSPESVHCFLGIIKDNQLTFATHGNPHAAVYYQKQGEWNTIDLIPDAADAADQLFDTVTEGKLSSGDLLLVASPQVGAHLQTEELVDIFSQVPASQAAARIESALSERKKGISYGGIVLFHPHHTQEAARSYHQVPQGSKASLDALQHTRHATAEVMSPPLMKNVKGIMSQLPKARRSGQKRHRSHEESRSGRTDKESAPEQFLVILGKALVYGCIGLVRVFVHIARGCVGLLKVLFLLATNYGGQRKDVLKHVTDWFAQKRTFITHLPLLSKVLFGSMLLLAVVFAGSIIISHIHTKQQVAQEQYTNLLSAIEDKKNAADASLIYGDDERAFTLLQEAAALLEKLPQDSAERTQTAAELQTSITTVRATLQKMVDVSPTLLAHIPDVQADGHIVQVEKIGNLLLAYASDDSRAYTLHIPTGAVEVIDHGTIPSLLISATPKEEDRVFFIAASGAAAFDPNTTGIISRDISFSSADSVPTAAVIYNTRMYALDPLAAQIYRHSPIQTGFDRGTPWITDLGDADISTGRALAIDGDVFVLTATDIVKFTSGAQAAFTIAGLDPQLENPSDIWTYNDVSYIYILEPTNKRLIVLNKDGSLVQQYTSALWKAPSSFVIDTPKQIAYVVDDNNIYSFSLK